VTLVIESDAQLDLDCPYIAELIDLEERLNADAPPRFSQSGRQLSPRRWIWKFQLYDAVSDEPVERHGKRGGASPVEVWLFSSPSIFYDRQGRYTAATRKYMHALCGHVVSDLDVKELLAESGLPFGLCGLRCLATLEMCAPPEGRKRLFKPSS
jgi:hypothetical protein